VVIGVVAKECMCISPEPKKYAICPVKLTFSELFHDQKIVCGRGSAPDPLVGRGFAVLSPRSPPPISALGIDFRPFNVLVSNRLPTPISGYAPGGAYMYVVVYNMQPC